MSGEVGGEYCTIAALGRPFSLGTLYDCRSDKILPFQGLPVQGKSSQKQSAAEFTTIDSDKIDEKFSALDVNSELKLSFLGGLVEVSGSGKYLKDIKSSNHVERVTLKLKYTTELENVTVDQVRKEIIQHPEIFKCGIATHVVTAITYGGYAFFVFEREKPSSSLDQEVSGILKAYVERIPRLILDEKGELTMSEHKKKKVPNFNCTYYGDIFLKGILSTYDDAFQFCKGMENLFRKGDIGGHAVPVTVQLYPLASLDNKACKVHSEISVQLVEETMNIMEDLWEVDSRCNDLLVSKAAQTSRGIRKGIMNFKRLVKCYAVELQEELSCLLPEIRGGTKHKSVLAELLDKRKHSPFNHDVLTTWLKTKESQVEILSDYIFSLSRIKYASKSKDLHALVMESNQVLCFFILIPVRDRLLEKMQKFFDKENFSKDGDTISIGNFSKDGDTLSIGNKIPKDTMEKKASLFKDFCEANTDSSNIIFVAAEDSSESSNFQAKIRHYYNGVLTKDNFEIPSAPQNVTVEEGKITKNSVQLKWENPSDGVSNIKEYKIFCEDKRGSDFDVIHFAPSETNFFDVTGLEPGCEYTISVQSACEIGVSLPCKTSKHITTKPLPSGSKPMVWTIS